MAIETTGDRDTEEDEAVANVVEVSSKQRPIIGKGKGKGKQRAQGERDLGLDQQRHRERRLQTIVVCQLTNFLQSHLFNLAIMTSLTLILMCLMTLMLATMLRMWMTGSAMNTSQSFCVRIHRRFPKQWQLR